MKKKIVTMLLTVCMTVAIVNVPVRAQVLDASDVMEFAGALDADTAEDIEKEERTETAEATEKEERTETAEATEKEERTETAEATEMEESIETTEATDISIPLDEMDHVDAAQSVNVTDDMDMSRITEEILDDLEVNETESAPMENDFALDVETESPEVLQAGDVAINTTNFPDSVFRDYVSTEFDADKNGILSVSEAQAVKEILVGDKGIASLKGIEYFTQLEVLRAFDNDITEVDLSKNTALKICQLSSCKLTYLNLTANHALEEINCGANRITRIDIGDCPNLKIFRADRNKLTSLDLGNYASVEELALSSNKNLRNIDPSKYPNLTHFFIAGTSLHNIDVTKNPKLQYLLVYDTIQNQLDVTHNPELIELDCMSVGLTALDVSHNPKLERLDCDKNQIKRLDLTHNPQLKTLNCSRCGLTELDVRQNPVLEWLTCTNNHITKLDLTKNPRLETLQCGNNQLRTLDIHMNPKLDFCTAWDNPLEYFNISLSEKMSRAYANGNTNVNSSEIQSYKDEDSYPDIYFSLDRNVHIISQGTVPYFDDVDRASWYGEAVEFVAQKRIMNGVGDDLFCPADNMTRAMFVTMLYKKEGKPEVAYEGSFSDVPKGQWYSEAVIWAKNAGITNGVGAGKFGTDTNITREQLATMLYSYAKYKKLDVDINEEALNTFSDKDKVSSWAEEGIKWAVSCGVMNGKGTAQGALLDPAGVASRAEAAQMIKNFVEKVEEE